MTWLHGDRHEHGGDTDKAGSSHEDDAHYDSLTPLQVRHCSRLEWFDNIGMMLYEVPTSFFMYCCAWVLV